MTNPKNPTFTHAQALEHWAYNSATGLISCAKTGKSRGYTNFDNYSYINVPASLNGGKQRHVKAHRLAWFLTVGQWPDIIDHKNGDRLDNRWQNLRSVTHGENRKNQSIKITECTPASGFKHWSISVDGKPVYRSRFCSMYHAYQHSLRSRPATKAQWRSYDPALALPDLHNRGIAERSAIRIAEKAGWRNLKPTAPKPANLKPTTTLKQGELL